MNYAYVVRNRNDSEKDSAAYGVKFLEVSPAKRNTPPANELHCQLSNATPPVLRRMSYGSFRWNECDVLHTTAQFLSLYRNPLLNPGEGPILVDLDDFSTKHTGENPKA